MKYFVDVDGRTQEVEVVERLGELVVSVNGQPFDLDYVEVDTLGQAALIHEGQSFGISIEGDPHELSISIAGTRYDVTIEDERERAAHAAEREKAAKGGLLKSVMPGVVAELLVAEGDTVTEGQPLLILEAMKMQNEIPAPNAGVVTQLHVKAGEAVGSGAKLATIEAPQ